MPLIVFVPGTLSPKLPYAWVWPAVPWPTVPVAYWLLLV